MTAMFKWTAKPKAPSPKAGDVRQVARLLIFPRCIGGEWRWLGVEKVEQTACLDWCTPPDEFLHETIKWRDVRWVA